MCNNSKKHIKNCKIIMKCNSKIVKEDLLDIEETIGSMKNDIKTIKLEISSKNSPK